MGSQEKKSPRYPKSHIVAASGIAAALSIFLLVIPTTDVEAKRTFVQLELQAPQSNSDHASHQELDALVSETVTLPKALDIARRGRIICELPASPRRAFINRRGLHNACQADHRRPACHIVEPPLCLVSEASEIVTKARHQPSWITAL